jgi:F-type H+-transporting ATPase subunit b
LTPRGADGICTALHPVRIERLETRRMPSLLSLAAAAEEHPIIDLDSTVFIQAIIFFITALLLSRFLFRPYLMVRAAREAGIDGARAEARRMDEEARARVADYDERFARAVTRANDERGKLAADAHRLQQEIVERARTETHGAVEQARTKLEAEAQGARAALEPRAQEIARDIGKKILGREVA